MINIKKKKKMFVYLSSDANTSHYDDNSSTSFRVKLPSIVQLKPLGGWSVALMDIRMPPLADNYKPGHLSVLSSICKPSVVNSTLKPVLQRLFLEDVKDWPVTIKVPRYVQINCESLKEIDIHLIDSEGNPPSFQPGKLTCTLHIKKSGKS